MNVLKKIGGFCKYWYDMYQCVGFLGLFWSQMWPKDTGNRINYIKVWEEK